MATVSYTYDLKCNGGNVSQVKINGTDVKRVKVNGVDVIHKFVKYTTTVIIRCSIVFDELRLKYAYTECGDRYYRLVGSGKIVVSYSTSGDALSLSGGQIPSVRVVLDGFRIFDNNSDDELYGTYDVTPTVSGVTVQTFKDVKSYSVFNDTEVQTYMYSNFSNSYMKINGKKNEFFPPMQSVYVTTDNKTYKEMLASDYSSHSKTVQEY